MADSNDTAICVRPGCEQPEKPISEFSIIKKTGKPNPYCKACRRLLANEWGAKNKDQVRASNQQYRADHIEELRQYDKDRAKEPERAADLKKSQQQWRINNPEKVREIDRRSYRKNRVARLARIRGRRVRIARWTPYTETGKLCATCGKDKALTEFWERADRPGKYRSSCKECIGGDLEVREANNERSRKWHAENRDKARENARAWRLANEDYLKRRNSERWHKYKADVAAGLRPPVDRTKAREWQREQKKKFPNKFKLARLAWLAANPSYVRVASQNRRARIRDAPGSHTVAQIEELWIKQNAICAYGPHPLLIAGKRVFHIEHDIPVTRPGTSNDISNIVLACPSCNCRKHNKTGAEFRALLAEEAEPLAKKTKKR